MRALIVGDEKMVAELTDLLRECDEMELVSFNQVGEAVAVLRQEKFDVSIVDSLTRDVEMLCRQINALRNILLVVMLRGGVDWKRLQSLNADGFIPPGAGRSELAARLKAVLRRRAPRNGEAGGCK